MFLLEPKDTTCGKMNIITKIFIHSARLVNYQFPLSNIISAYPIRCVPLGRVLTPVDTAPP